MRQEITSFNNQLVPIYSYMTELLRLHGTTMSKTLRSGGLQLFRGSLKLRKNASRHDLQRAFATVTSGLRYVIILSV